MTRSGFLSPKNFVLALSAAGVLTALLASTRADAQTVPPGATVCCGGNAYYLPGSGVVSMGTSTSSGLDTSANEHFKARQAAAKKIVDTPENRQFAKRVYEAAMQGISQILRAEGKAKAIALSQNPQNNAPLMAVVRQAHSGQYLLTQTMIVDSMVDGFALANGERGSSFSLVNNWDADVAFAAGHLSQKPDDKSELAYLSLQSEALEAFGPKNKVAARAVLAANGAHHSE